MTVVERFQETGIRRVGSPARGFRYARVDGGRVSGADRERIRALVIPPAWTEVFVSTSPASAVQAIGRDRAGRWQYLYTEKQTRLRERRKRERLLAFLQMLPGLRARVARDVGGSGLTRERVLSAMVRLLLRGFLRPGSQAYTKQNGTYGLSTLRPRHVRVQGGRVTLAYRGKGNQSQLREIDDPAAARVVRALLRDPGRELFRYRGEDGSWVNIRRRHLNEYLKEVTGSSVTAKDFRTWAGSLLGACALARQGYPAPPSGRAVRSRISAAMKETAHLLGNTPTVCRASYVSPQVLSAFEAGRLIADPPALEHLVRASPRVLAAVERKLCRIIRNGNQESARRAARRPLRIAPGTVPLRDPSVASPAKNRVRSTGRARAAGAAAPPTA